MKACIGLIAALASLTAFAIESREPELAPSELSRIERTLREARDSRSISEQQYRQSRSFLRDSQCGRVDRTFTEAMRTKWSVAISARREFAGAKATQAFGLSSWRIVHATLPNLDPVFLFYSGERPTAEWSGGAAVFDAPEIKRWVLTNAPGIPDPLAHCFAWHVTFNRD